MPGSEMLAGKRGSIKGADRYGGRRVGASVGHRASRPPLGSR
jgi:hypothetical protein